MFNYLTEKLIFISINKPQKSLILSLNKMVNTNIFHFAIDIFRIFDIMFLSPYW